MIRLLAAVAIVSATVHTGEGPPIEGATVLIEAARWILRFWTMPVQIEIGLGLLLAGAALIMLSLVLERIHDVRVEKAQST